MPVIDCPHGRCPRVVVPGTVVLKNLPVNIRFFGTACIKVI